MTNLAPKHRGESRVGVGQANALTRTPRTMPSFFVGARNRRFAGSLRYIGPSAPAGPPLLQPPIGAVFFFRRRCSGRIAGNLGGPFWNLNPRELFGAQMCTVGVSHVASSSVP